MPKSRHSIRIASDIGLVRIISNRSEICFDFRFVQLLEMEMIISFLSLSISLAPYYMFVDLRNKLTHAPLTLQTHGRTICLLYAIWYIIRPMEISRITNTQMVYMEMLQLS